MGKYVVYILKSERTGKSYIGQTRDLGSRLVRHNSGQVRSTRALRPMRVVYEEYVESRAETMKRERWLKSGVGREFVKRLIVERTAIASAEGGCPQGLGVLPPAAGLALRKNEDK